jgi:hypothetical protein
MSLLALPIPQSPAFPLEPGFDLAEVKGVAAGSEFQVMHAALEPVVDGASAEAQGTRECVVVD